MESENLKQTEREREKEEMFRNVYSKTGKLKIRVLCKINISSIKRKKKRFSFRPSVIDYSFIQTSSRFLFHVSPPLFSFSYVQLQPLLFS